MDKQRVIEAYCALSGEVASKVFQWEHAADCFCSPQSEGWSYAYSNHVLDYIREAVYMRMEAERGKHESKS